MIPGSRYTGMTRGTRSRVRTTGVNGMAFGSTATIRHAVTSSVARL